MGCEQTVKAYEKFRGLSMVWKTAEGFVQGCAAPTCDLVEVSSSKEPMVPV